MNVMSVGASSLAHGVHYAVLAVGLVGLLALLAPQWAGGHQPRAPLDEHERRVAELHQQLANPHLGPGPSVGGLAPIVDQLTATLLPIAIVSSTAAAGVHAAVAPAHFRELLVFGVFFAASAVTQLVWSIWMALAPSWGLLIAGVVGNAGVVVLWAVTRTVGLPFGLLPTPEEVGPWDLCCGAWELVVVVAGLQLLRGRSGHLDPPTLDSWSPSARTWGVVSALALGALTLSGGHA